MVAASLWRRLGAFLIEVLLYWSVLLLVAIITGQSIVDFLFQTESGPRETAFGDRVDGGVSVSFPPGGIGLWLLLAYARTLFGAKPTMGKHSANV